MHLWEIVIVSIGLSLEFFTLAIVKGANQRQLPKHMFLLISLVFGMIETIMLACGMGMALVPLSYIHNEAIEIFNRWISALILIFLGCKMLLDVKNSTHVVERLEADLNYKESVFMAVKSSFDTLLLGIVFIFLGARLVSGLFSIFCISSLCVGIGLWLGGRMGSQYRSMVSGVSGVILLVMGARVIRSFFQLI